MVDYKIIVSKSGTRHIVGNPPGLRGILAHAFRTTTLCGFGVRSDEALPLSKATRDCEFCINELEVVERRKQLDGQAA
jgi:hypothetical protein